MPPDLREQLADPARATFGPGVRLNYLETPTLTLGDVGHMTPGVTPVEYIPPEQRRPSRGNQ